MIFPNGDMVGHTGVYEAVLISMEALDLCLTRLKNVIEVAGGMIKHKKKQVKLIVIQVK